MLEIKSFENGQNFFFYEWTLPLLATVKHLVESVNAWKVICKGNKSADLFTITSPLSSTIYLSTITKNQPFQIDETCRWKKKEGSNFHHPSPVISGKFWSLIPWW